MRISCGKSTLKAHCSTLQVTATHLNTTPHFTSRSRLQHLQHTATYCNILQHTQHCEGVTRQQARLKTHGSTPHYTATHCNTLQHTSIHCKILQRTVTHCTLRRGNSAAELDSKGPLLSETSQSLWTVVQQQVSRYVPMYICV